MAKLRETISRYHRENILQGDIYSKEEIIQVYKIFKSHGRRGGD